MAISLARGNINVGAVSASAPKDTFKVNNHDTTVKNIRFVSRDGEKIGSTKMFPLCANCGTPRPMDLIPFFFSTF